MQTINTRVSNRNINYEYLEHAPLPVLVLEGSELKIQFANADAMRLFKIPRDGVLGKSVSTLLPEVFDANVIKALSETGLTNGEAFNVKEKQIIFWIGEEVKITWFDIKCNPLQDGSGRVVGMVVFFTDVSERVISKKSLVQRGHHLNNFFKQAPIGLVCYRGAEFIVDFANDKALEMWGKSVEEVKGKAIYEIFPEVLHDPAIHARHTESLQRLKRGETHVVNEVELTFVRNGKPTTGWYNYIHEPYTDDLGQIIGMMAIAIEVTDQVLARRKLQMVTDAIPSLVSYINSQEQYELVNKAYETWFERSRETVLGKTIQQVIGSGAYETIKPHVAKVLAGNVETFESWLDYADGKRRFVSASYIPHIDSGKRVLGYIGLVHDLTERKKHEEVMYDSEARMRLIIEGVGAGTFEYDLVSGVINWSEELKALVGLGRDVVVDPQTARSVVHPEDLARVLEHSGNLRLPGTNGYMAIDYRIVRKDNGNVRWLHSRSKVLLAEKAGEQIPSRVIGFSIDITDQKLAEDQLRELSRNLEIKVQERTAELSAVNNLLLNRNEDLSKTQSVLQQLIDSSIEYIAVISTDLRFLAVNKAFENFVHKSRTELIGNEIFVAYEGARGSRQVELLKKAFAGEALHLRLNPSIARPNVWFDTHYVPLVINNKVEGVIVLSRDITDIVKSEQELSNINRQLQEAQRLSKLGSWEWDVNTGAVVWSDEMYRIYGYEEKFPVDFVKATERMSPEDADRSSKRSQEHIQHALENFRNHGQRIYEIPPTEFHIQLPGGEKKLLRNTGKIELTTDGKMHRILGVVQDVTQIRATEERLHELIDTLEIKNRELESFNYVASHDLKEPLRNIRTIIDLISRTKPADNTTHLGKIDRAAKRMSDLIDSILKLGEASNSEIQFSEVDLNKVVLTMMGDLEARIKETNADIQADKLPLVQGDENQINQVFTNLIGNAIKFCQGRPVVRISCEKVTGSEVAKTFASAKEVYYWRISFTDNGIGFDLQYKQQIFEPFQRLHGRTEYAGTGIGLSIVKKIIERHHGFVDVISEPGNGATFVIWLPVSKFV